MKDIKAYHKRPPLFELSGTADQLRGDHLNQVWDGLAHRLDQPTGAGMPVVVKYYGQAPGKIAIELACSLAAVALGVPVPEPALVIADKDLLPGLDDAGTSTKVLLFGSWFEPSQQLLRRPQSEEFVWKSVCSSKTGAPGAVWDELVANDDRHFKNLIFDGVNWWLIDHDKALPPLAAIERQVMQTLAAEGANLAEYRSSKNLLALKMLFLRPQDHGIHDCVSLFASRKPRLQEMSHYAKGWTHKNAQLSSLLTHASVVLDSIILRLPGLALLLDKRLSKPEYGTLSWTSS